MTNEIKTADSAQAQQSPAPAVQTSAPAAAKVEAVTPSTPTEVKTEVVQENKA